MKKMNLKMLAVVAAFAALTPLNSKALDLTLGGGSYSRKASLSSATEGYTGLGNATAATVAGYFSPLAPWTERGSVEPSSGSGLFISGMFTINVTSGSFGGTAASGTWTINNPAFWATYSNAAISMHVGNGGGDPDHFVWLLEQGQTTGTWSYKKLTGSGGGLSNLKLYSSNTGSNVPDNGSTLALLGLGICSLGLLRRKLVA